MISVFQETVSWKRKKTERVTNLHVHWFSLGRRSRIAPTGLCITMLLVQRKQLFTETVCRARLMPAFESPGCGAVIGDKCWFISTQLFTSLHLSDWWWWFQRAVLFQRGCRVVVLSIYMTVPRPSSCPPRDAGICVWSGDKSRLSFYLDGVEKAGPPSLCPFQSRRGAVLHVYVQCVSGWYK